MCESIETEQKVARSANGREVCVDNPGRREIGVVQVDGCLIKDTRRVDWMIKLPEKKKLKDGVAAQKLVELKGTNVPHAFTQVAATLKHPALAATLGLVDECFIVSQQKPAMQSAIQVALFAFREEFSVPIHIVPRAEIDASW